MHYKLCILAAGEGKRNTSITGLHKALLPLAQRPVISHILDKVDKSIEVVVAVGYQSEQVKSYLTAVHNDRQITYVDVDNYNNNGSGPGYSLLSCKKHLECPFIFTAVDTVIGEDVFPLPNHNWLSISAINEEDSIKYCLVDGNKYLDKLYYGVGKKAYIGIAGIYDFDSFWKKLSEKRIIKNEYQVVHGFEGLKNVRLVNFDWYDTGNDKSYEAARKVFDSKNVINKNDETLFIDNEKVVKYFSNSDKSIARVKRTKYLNGTVPTVMHINDNMYSYEFVDGKLLSDVTDSKVFAHFLNFCNDKFFSKRFKKDMSFLSNCKSMYETKTRKRVVGFAGSALDEIEKINDISVPKIEVLLNNIDWNRVYDIAIPVLFHGDLQPGNILYNNAENSFTLIDWRESFGSSLEVGDIYYDLSKLYHASIIGNQTVKDNLFEYEIVDGVAKVDYYIQSNLFEFLQVLKGFCKVNGFDWNNIKLLGILHYINISTLYNDFRGGRYGEFLFLLGKYLLTQHLKHNNEN